MDLKRPRTPRGLTGVRSRPPLMETGIGPAPTTPIQRPELFYGFIGVAIAWQVVFLLIARNVHRYRLLMLPAILEKLSFGIPVLLLYAWDRVGTDVLLFGSLDLVLGVLFILAFRSTRIAPASA